MPQGGAASNISTLRCLTTANNRILQKDSPQRDCNVEAKCQRNSNLAIQKDMVHFKPFLVFPVVWVSKAIRVNQSFNMFQVFLQTKMMFSVQCYCKFGAMVFSQSRAPKVSRIIVRLFRHWLKGSGHGKDLPSKNYPMSKRLR